MFERIVVSVFLKPEGYCGALDDECDRLRESWFALSWGCMQAALATEWKARARVLRRTFWKNFGRWVMTFGRATVFSAHDRFLHAVFFSTPERELPLAVGSLAGKGMLERRMERRGEQEVQMYTPTPKLAHRLIAYMS